VADIPSGLGLALPPSILSSYPLLGFPSRLFPSGFSTKILYVFRFALMRATCAAHLIHHDLIILIILSEAVRKYVLASWFGAAPVPCVPALSVPRCSLATASANLPCRGPVHSTGKVKLSPCNRPWRPTELWDVEAPTFSIHSAHRLR
jgi:hypothetical protein